jgi:hypothetical protein
MITYKDIKIAINTYLKNKFGIEINSNDLKEGYKRPSFFVSFDNFIRSSNQEQVQKSFTVRIYYFPTDRYKYYVELLDIQDSLESLFDLKLEVLDRKFNINEVSTIVTDGVLEFSFDIEYYEGKDITESPLMEELEI